MKFAADEIAFPYSLPRHRHNFLLARPGQALLASRHDMLILRAQCRPRREVRQYEGCARRVCRLQNGHNLHGVVASYRASHSSRSRFPSVLTVPLAQSLTTTLPGTRARKDCGENPPFFAESNFTAFFPDLCPSSTGACAASITSTGRSMAAGFPIATPATFAGTVQSQNLNFKQGMVQQYNLNIEHQMPRHVVLTVGYAGSRSTHILVDGMNLNVASPGACGTVPGYTFGCGIAKAPYSQFGTIANINDIGSARYDSLQVKAETKSARHGLYALVGYTYARNFDTGFNDGLGTSTGATYYPLPGTARSDWSLSQLQLNHNFTGSVIYELPFGRGKQFGSTWSGPVNAVLGNWEFDVIEKITSGFPLFMVSSSNGSGVSFASSVNRPNQVCSGHLSNPGIGEWFNTQCFVDPPSGELGNSNRTPLYGPGFVNTDFSTIKHFRLPFREGMQLDFRAEFFNVFNHPQFFQPGQDVDSSNFGRITATVNNPRLVQFALKFTF